MSDLRLELSELETLIVGVAALLAGTQIRRRVPFLSRIDMPNAVVGAAAVATLVLISNVLLKIDLVFASNLRDIMLLVFFVTIGLEAKLGELRAGGRPLVILCAVTVLLIVMQNLTGVAVAMSWGAHPAYGLLAGSLSFVGGPGTAVAWAKEAEAVGIRDAQVIAVGAATLAVIGGALVAGPFTGWLIKRHGLRSASTLPETHSVADAPVPNSKPISNRSDLERVFSTLLVISVVVLFGQKLNEWARAAGLILPGFLSAMLAGVIITNFSNAFRYRLDGALIEKAGEIALNLFLVISLMSVKLVAVAAVITPLAINLALQLTIAIAIGYFLLFRLLGRDFDAAVTVGGFLGFGISSMPVAMATMEEVANRFGPAPKAFLLVTLAGAFFVDLANAVVTKLFLLSPLFTSVPSAASG